MQHVGELCECTTQAVCRCLQGLFVRVVLQLVGQVIDRIEVPLISLTNQPLELAAGVAAGLIEIADGITLQGRQHRTYPGEQVLAGREVPAHDIAERVDVVDELGSDVDFSHQRVAAVLVLRRREGILQVLYAASELADLAAHLVKIASQRAGPFGQPVEVTGVVVDQLGPAFQKGADSARLVRGSELLRDIPGRPGDAADRGDIRQLADSVRHLLQVGQGLRRA